MKPKTLAILGAAAALTAVALLLFPWPSRQTKFQRDPALEKALDGVTNDYRTIIVLVDGIDTLDAGTRARALTAGRIVFWRKHAALDEIARNLSDQYRQAAASGFRKPADGVRQLLQYLAANPALHDADKMAFLDLVDELAAEVPANGSKRNPLADPIRAARDNLQSIQLAYREEVTRIFSQFATRGGSGAREKWDAYVADLRKTISREKTLADFGDIPEEPAEETRGGGTEMSGADFAPKTVALTFDDGPHPKYTEQVLALLQKYGIRACFFEIGSNLGVVRSDGQVVLSPNAEISRKVLAAGHVIANHSYSHPVMTKLTEEQRNSEIDRTDALIEKISGHKPILFRPPYGARNKDILSQLATDGLRSVLWTIDSLDWADPVPESIAMRVLHELNQKQKGIILFHDIHKQGVMALGPVIEELQRQDYQFLSFDNGQFVKSAPPVEVQRSGQDETEAAPAQAPAEGKSRFYRESWAVIVGINDYDNWPTLRYAVNDANGVEETLVTKFGFKRENVRKLINRDATRQRIMEVLGDELTDGKKVQREDRVFFFFAGHGATRTLDDGRQIGFIVPVDADRTNYYSTAISMTALREASDLIPAKHIYFVMDSCYSGLALSRGGGAFARDRTYLEEVTRREARQILTAGGADQEVADDGPNGHSVFTWALLQGLQGQADLDGNGFITASELGAYVSPIVASFSKQTPTVGNLVGSEGGEFVFELQPEPLTSLTQQLDGRGMRLSEQLTGLQKEITAKQAELLRLQQSVQSETVKLAELKRSDAVSTPATRRAASESPVQTPAANSSGAPPAATRPKSKSAQAYDLDRQGLQLYREKKYDLAAEKYQAAVQLKPNDPVLMNNLGFIYYAMGRNDDALAWFEKTLAADPKRKEVHGNIADLYLKLGRKDEAKSQYEQYLALYPASPKAEEIRKTLQTLN
jgi:peptidoglycan/xylan/chitin deacetylase (PgdA/CDA1 family)/TolA-binding protein